MRGAAARAPADHDAPAAAQRPQTPGYAFNLHAKRRIPAHDRKALERLCRYLLRPPIANDRLRWADDNTIAVRLTHPWADGTTHILLSPQELVTKLVPLVPPPRVNRVRYLGFLAPNAKLRPLVVPKPKPNAASNAAPACATHTPAQRRSCWTPWAELMARVFAVDVLACPKCNSRMQRIAVITEPRVIRDFLASVGLANDSPASTIAPAPGRQLEIAC